jgi:hypothetical protein
MSYLENKLAHNWTDRRLFSYDPTFGTVRYSYYDPDNDVFAIETLQDAAPVIEANKAAFNSTDEKARYDDGLHHVARIPLAVMERLIREKILVIGKNGDGEGNKRFKRWLNSPENRFFRTRPGTV